MSNNVWSWRLCFKYHWLWNLGEVKRLWVALIIDHQNIYDNYDYFSNVHHHHRSQDVSNLRVMELKEFHGSWHVSQGTEHLRSGWLPFVLGLRFDLETSWWLSQAFEIMRKSNWIPPPGKLLEKNKKHLCAKGWRTMILSGRHVPMCHFTVLLHLESSWKWYPNANLTSTSVRDITLSPHTLEQIFRTWLSHIHCTKLFWHSNHIGWTSLCLTPLMWRSTSPRPWPSSPWCTSSIRPNLSRLVTSKWTWRICFSGSQQCNTFGGYQTCALVCEEEKPKLWIARLVFFRWVWPYSHWDRQSILGGFRRFPTNKTLTCFFGPIGQAKTNWERFTVGTTEQHLISNPWKMSWSGFVELSKTLECYFTGDGDTLHFQDQWHTGLAARPSIETPTSLWISSDKIFQATFIQVLLQGMCLHVLLRLSGPGGPGKNHAQNQLRPPSFSWKPSLLGEVHTISRVAIAHLIVLRLWARSSLATLLRRCTKSGCCHVKKMPKSPLPTFLSVPRCLDGGRVSSVSPTAWSSGESVTGRSMAAAPAPLSLSLLVFGGPRSTSGPLCGLPPQEASSRVARAAGTAWDAWRWVLV